MVAFDEVGNLKKYESTEHIIDKFCQVRYDFYVRRKAAKLKELEQLLKMLGNKKRFLTEVMCGDIKLFDDSGTVRKSRRTFDIISDLDNRGYDRINDNEEDEGDEKSSKLDGGKGFKYLLSLQFGSITEEKINKLNSDINSKILMKAKIKDLSEKQMWTNELDEFVSEYKVFISDLEKEVKKKIAKAGK